MSVVLKANELNSLIYKYFLESGLSHSAYTLFNEAALAQPLQEFRFDIRAGHLLSILEKGLIYAKIQAHVNFSEYTDCQQPFYLLKPHTCKIVQKVRKERSELLKEMEEQLNDGIKRTNSIYNAAIANREFQEIVYEARGRTYFDKFPKIKLPANQSDAETKPGKFILNGTETHTLLYNCEDFEIDLLKYDTINEQITVERIFPSVTQGQLAKGIHETITNQQAIQLFEGNQVTLFDLRQDEPAPLEFTVPVDSQLTVIESNPNIPYLVCFKSDQRYCIINTNSFKVLRKGEGNFFWRAFDQYLLIEQDTVRLYSVTKVEPLQSFESEVKWQDVKFNLARNLFIMVSYSEPIMQVFTFDSEKPLFIFSFENKTLKQVEFVTSNSVDYLCWLTDDSIFIFDLSLNAYSKVIEIQEYDSHVQQLSILKKANKDEMYLLALGAENLIIYDISNSKMERIEIQGRVQQLKQMGLGRVAMITDSSIYFLVGQYIEVLFK